MKESFCKLELKSCRLLHTLLSALYLMFSLSFSLRGPLFCSANLNQRQIFSEMIQGHIGE